MLHQACFITKTKPYLILVCKKYHTIFQYSFDEKEFFIFQQDILKNANQNIYHRHKHKLLTFNQFTNKMMLI